MLDTRNPDAGTARRALEKLCQTYWYPLYGFVRRQGTSPADAEDAVQGFFHHFLKRSDFDRVEPERGRLRSYLLGALKHFLANESAKSSALKRGGGMVCSLDREWAEDQLLLEPSSEEWSPERLYDRRWALTQLEAARERVAESYAKRGKGEQFRVLEPYLAWNSGEDYALAAVELGMKETTARVAIHRLRKRFREALQGEIAETVASPQELAEELKIFPELL